MKVSCPLMANGATGPHRNGYHHSVTTRKSLISISVMPRGSQCTGAEKQTRERKHPRKTDGDGVIDVEAQHHSNGDQEEEPQKLKSKAKLKE